MKDINLLCNSSNSSQLGVWASYPFPRTSNNLVHSSWEYSRDCVLVSLLKISPPPPPPSGHSILPLNSHVLKGKVWIISQTNAAYYATV